MSPQLAFAGAPADTHHNYLKALDRMMVTLAPHNARVAKFVREEYRAYLDLLVLPGFAAVEHALYTGGLVPLPEPERFNVRVRTEGPAPIAEKDLAHQASYVAARPATVGALLDIASRVASGPIEITSLVRHTDYQDALRSTNANANTSVPMHTMGLAFDIALVNTPLATVHEIRDVLQAMQRAGDILFIGERRQLVFHVVPHPSRLGYFTDVYAAAMAAATNHSDAMRTTPTTADRTLTGLTRPLVSTEVIAVHPTEDFAVEWWSVDDARSDVLVEVSPTDRAVGVPSYSRAERPSLIRRLTAAVQAVLLGARNLLSFAG